MLRIGKRHGQRVQKHRCGSLERQPVLVETGHSLLHVPFAEHVVSLLQHYRPTSTYFNPTSLEVCKILAKFPVSLSPCSIYTALSQLTAQILTKSFAKGAAHENADDFSLRRSTLRPANPLQPGP